MNFQLKSPFKPTGDQPQAIDKIMFGLTHNLDHQVLLGVTGSGKTFTAANVIAKIKRPTLVISHNKTLAAQLYQEFRDFFPCNSVNYFVSYYDFYQPEAYIPQTDTYIEKESQINEEIDKLRLACTTNLLTRKDTIVVSSVSCIYNIGSPKEYGNFALELKKGVRIFMESIIKRLVDLQYVRDNFQFKRGTFRVLGETIDIYPAYEDIAVRIVHDGEKVQNIGKIDPMNGNLLESDLPVLVIYPAKHFMTDPDKHDKAFAEIRRDLDVRIKELKKQNKHLEAYRLEKKVNFDLEMIAEVGYVNGIENYSRYFENRKPGEPSFTLLDYFNSPYGRDWLLVIDESHMTIPQIRGMYNGDRRRKQTLIDFGFRLPSALDNRPLTFLEFMHRTPQTIYASATPNEWEMSLARESAAKVILSDPEPVEGESQDGYRTVTRQARNDSNGIVEQLIRPTGIIDPQIIIRPTQSQITDLLKEIIRRKEKGERVLVTTLTKRMAEDLASYLNDRQYLNKISTSKIQTYPHVCYLHSDVKTLVRSDILDDLRLGKYDCLIGINLLREGLDLPEVSLVAILDADKEGFLRSKTSLIQTMGRAARHVNGCVIMYADVKTLSMTSAIEEIERRRLIQINYNKKYNISPQKIIKPVRGKLVEKEKEGGNINRILDSKKSIKYKNLLAVDFMQLTPFDKSRFIKKLEGEMKAAASILDFELALEIRDKIKELQVSRL